MISAFTLEWIDALAERLKADDRYQSLARGFDSSFQFVLKGREELAVGLFLPNCSETWSGDRGRPVDFSLVASPEDFERVLSGMTGIVPAVTSGKIELRGSKLKLLKYMTATQRFTEICMEIPTDFSQL